MIRNKWLIVIGILIIVVVASIYFWQKNKAAKICEITNCHGLDIICGQKPPGMCTAIYQLGDNCRQFTTCGIQNGKCQQIQNDKFNACKSCAQKCEQDYKNNPEKTFDCAATCYNITE